MLIRTRQRNPRVPIRVRNGFVIVLMLLSTAFSPTSISANEELIIVRRDGVTVRLNVELALDQQTQMSGLMWRESLAPRSGMLFDFGQTRPIRMWMKNTLIPLDMLFANDTGQVVYIKRRTVPESLQVIAPDVAARYVLEINGGEASELKLGTGDRLLVRNLLREQRVR